MFHWTDKYPHTVTASVLLLDGKIYNWKIGNQIWKHPSMVKMRLEDMKYLDEGRFTVENKSFTVQNPDEHEKVFTVLAREWFKNWEISEHFYGEKPY